MWGSRCFSGGRAEAAQGVGVDRRGLGAGPWDTPTSGGGRRGGTSEGAHQASRGSRGPTQRWMRTGEVHTEIATHVRKRRAPPTTSHPSPPRVPSHRAHPEMWGDGGRGTPSAGGICGSGSVLPVGTPRFCWWAGPPWAVLGCQPMTPCPSLQPGPTQRGPAAQLAPADLFLGAPRGPGLFTGAGTQKPGSWERGVYRRGQHGPRTAPGAGAGLRRVQGEGQTCLLSAGSRPADLLPLPGPGSGRVSAAHPAAARWVTLHGAARP